MSYLFNIFIDVLSKEVRVWLENLLAMILYFVIRKKVDWKGREIMIVIERKS